MIIQFQRLQLFTLTSVKFGRNTGFPSFFFFFNLTISKSSLHSILRWPIEQWSRKVIKVRLTITLESREQCLHILYKFNRHLYSVSLWSLSIVLWRNVDSFLSFVCFWSFSLVWNFVVIFSSWLVFSIRTSWQLSHRIAMFNWIKRLLRVQNYAINCNYLRERKSSAWIYICKCLEYWIYFMHESCLCIYKGRLFIAQTQAEQFI